MTPDDPRHGTVAGQVQGCRCDLCREAKRRYEKRRAYEAAHGAVRLVPSLGAQRRIRALMALGWTCHDIAGLIGGTRAGVRNVLHRDLIRPVTHDQYVTAYNQLSMTVGPSQVTRDRARAKGWPPPLAWDDDQLDLPAGRAYAAGRDRVVDRVVVELALACQPVRAHRLERLEVAQVWEERGLSLNELDRIQGWNVRRDRREAVVAA